MSAMRDVLLDQEVQAVLGETFYGDGERATRPSPRPKRLSRPKPSHYEILCISMYKDDLKRLDERVETLKRSGHRKMNRSALIRFALDTMDVSKLPKSY